MPRKSESPEIHLKLVLDTEELFSSFMLIKKNQGIRNNTDALRNLIINQAKSLINEKEKSVEDYQQFIDQWREKKANLEE